MALDYKSSGVDVEAGYKSVELMKQYVKTTMRPEVLGGLGGFSGAFDLSQISKMKNPVLLSGTDGVGTKQKLAFLMDRHDTVGIDCVAMCVNDVSCAGGDPLFFLDYIACGKNIPEKIATIVKGVAEGCVQADSALLGGETAEHPGIMPDEEYDTKPDAYENTSLQSIQKYTIEQFLFWTEDEFASRFRKMLTLEQYRNEEMAELYSQCIVAGPVAYMEDLFRELIQKGALKDENPRQLAVEYYAPLFLFINMFDKSGKDEDYVEILRNHTEHFTQSHVKDSGEEEE